MAPKRFRTPCASTANSVSTFSSSAGNIVEIDGGYRFRQRREGRNAARVGGVSTAGGMKNMAQQLLMTAVQQRVPPPTRRERTAVMDAFFAGLVFGIAFGMVVVGFLAVGSYQRGFSQALERRKEWRSARRGPEGGGARASVGLPQGEVFSPLPNTGRQGA